MVHVEERSMVCAGSLWAGFHLNRRKPRFYESEELKNPADLRSLCFLLFKGIGKVTYQVENPQMSVIRDWLPQPGRDV